MAGFPALYLLFLAALIILPIAILIRSSRHRRRAGILLPPSPWALPVIGHLHHLVGKLPHHKLRDLARRHGPLMLLRLGELPVVVASSADAAREIMKAHDLAFASRPIGPATRLVLPDGEEGIVFAPYGDGWRQLRKICTLELLSPRRVLSLRAVREQEVHRLLLAVASPEKTATNGLINLSRMISSYVADSSVRAIIGSRFKDREAFFRLMESGLKLFSSPSLPDLFPSSRLAMLISRAPGRMKQNRKETMAFMETIIEEHRAAREASMEVEKEDLVDVLLRVQRDGELHFSLTTDNIKAAIADLFIAGSDTAATTLQWAMSELLNSPKVMQKAQNEVRQVLNGQGRISEESLSTLHYLHLVIKETLRLHPPAPLLLPRECREPCQILGFDVPKGTMVLVNIFAIGRDPNYWDAPNEFTPERFEENNIDFKGINFEYIPFGAGRRICPGMTFGLANVELALASLLYHFDWDLPDGMQPGDLDMAEALAVTARRETDLLVVPVVRVPIVC
uniref:Cytochrome P450 n=1 Tax=Leersia perrieri TaxID=77586 RepID=A0A0D9WSH6_9ORYZ